MSHVVAGMQVFEQRKHSSAAMETLLGAVDTLLSSTGAELLSREREAEQQFVEAGCELNRQLLRQPGAALVSALSASIVCLVGEHFHALVCSSPCQRVLHRQGRSTRPRQGPKIICIEHASAKRQHKPSEGRCKPQEARRIRAMILSEGTGPTI